MARTLTTAELASQRDAVELLDVRRKADRDADPHGIAGAQWRNPEEIDEWIGELPRDKDIVIYCARGGSVSNSVLDRLLAEGHRARYSEGGLEAWKAQPRS